MLVKRKIGNDPVNGGIVKMHAVSFGVFQAVGQALLSEIGSVVVSLNLIMTFLIMETRLRVFLTVLPKTSRSISANDFRQC